MFRDQLFKNVNVTRQGFPLRVRNGVHRNRYRNEVELRKFADFDKTLIPLVDVFTEF